VGKTKGIIKTLQDLEFSSVAWYIVMADFKFDSDWTSSC
jgi:hypothetical protein